MAFFRVRLKTPLVHVASLVLALFAATAAASTRDVSDDERRMKAVFLYKFVPYVAWPPEAAAEPIVIGATNADMTREVAAATRGRQVEGRSIAVRHIREGETTAGLQMLFVGAAEASRIAPIATQTRGQPLLIVSDVPGGLDRGAVINFLLSEGRVRFEVSLPAAEARRLVISSRLLKVAEHVRTGSP